ncbi:MAG: hypothetical protein R2939_13630 [Kofleriaceae bacterium]
MSHRFHFFRAGGVDQVSLRDGADLLALPTLDEKLWIALAMPTRDVDLDAATLDALDDDHDGRIRVHDIKAAIAFLEATLVRPGDVLRSKPAVALEAIADKAIATSARQMLIDLGKPDATELSVADADAVKDAFAKTRLNGDGIVYPGSTDDAELARLITDIAATHGAVVDRSGKDGTDAEHAKAFFAEVDALATWRAAGKASPETIHPLGEGTAAAADTLGAVEAKLDDFFARCRLAAFDPRAATAMAGQEADFLALGAKALTSGSDDIAQLPLATVGTVPRLPLGAGLNPAWAERVAAFVDAAVTPIVGKRDALTPDDLAAVRAKLAAFRAWRGEQPQTKLGGLDAAWLETLAGPELRGKLDTLIASDLELSDSYAKIASVSKLVRLQRDFGRILRNFANFSDFYSRQDGVFQAGTLYIDGRAASLCVPVSDPAKHAVLAGSSNAYLAYCDLKRGSATRQVAAAISNGDADNLFVGRNGVFYDRDGKDWDATITKIVGNPISVREAFWTPYKKLVATVEAQMTKRAADADAKATAKMEGAGTALASATDAKPTDAKAAGAAPKKFDLGTIALVGVAVGGIAALVGALISGFLGLGKWMPVGLLAVLLAISGPSMLLAWFKLRTRNLGPILDSNGWAINGRARVNVAFGAAMTKLAKLPPGATRNLDDPYADKRRPWKLYIFLVLLLVTAGLWFFGKLDKYLPDSATSISVMGSRAPAYRAPAEAEPPPAAPAAEPAPPQPAP